MTDSPGKTMMLVIGILFIVFGSIGVLFALAGLLATSFYDNTLPTYSGVSWGVYYLIATFATSFRVFIGISAIKNRNNPEKYKLLWVFGVIVIALTLLDVVLTHTIFTFTNSLFNELGLVFTLITTAIAFALPFLYTIAAQKLVNESQAQ